MRSINEFFARFGTLLLFIILEMVCLIMIVQLNDNQKSIFEHTMIVLNGEFQSRMNQLTDYIHLKEKVKQLQEENAKLRSQKVIRRDIIWNEKDSSWNTDSSLLYIYYPTKVISSHLQLRNNTLTINKGLKQGINEGWGVATDNGVVGVVRYCSDHYCSVIPLVSLESSVSANIQNRNYFGNIEWSGPNIGMAKLTAVPKHAKFEIGDTVLTSGYSTIFPKGLPIGTITHYNLPSGSNFFDIDVALMVDFGNLEELYVVEHKDQKAIQETFINKVGYE